MEGRDKPPTVNKRDAATKNELLQAQLRTPRYLFRGWHSCASDAPSSGGIAELNSCNAIMPLGFYKQWKKSYSNRPDCKSPPVATATSSTSKMDTIFGLTRPELSTAVKSHLAIGPQPTQTPFSSWTASPQVAVKHAAKGNYRSIIDKKTAYSSVIDTRALPQKNVIVHVPSLQSMIGVCMCPEERLAYGIIESLEAHRAVPLQAFIHISVPDGNVTFFTRMELTGTACGIMPTDISNAKSVAKLYGIFWRDGFNGLDATVSEALGTMFEVPKHLCANSTVLLDDVVFTKGFGEVEQMLRLLRAVVHLRHGRDARERKRKMELKEAEAAMLLDMGAMNLEG